MPDPMSKTADRDRFVLSLDLQYRQVVDQIRTKLYEKHGSLSIPSMVAVVQKAIADLAQEYGIKAPAPSPRVSGRPRQRKNTMKRKPRVKVAEAEPVEVA